MKKRLLLLVVAPGFAVSMVGTAVAVTSFGDAQANNPQVAGQRRSSTTAVFPTNKQNEPTLAVSPTDADVLIAGANDEQEQPPCGPGRVRGADALPNDCAFFPGVGTSGVYISTDGGSTWANRGLLDDQAGWKASNLVSDGDPVIVYGPRPDGHGGFNYANGGRAYYATLASFKNSPYPPKKAPEVLAVSSSDDNGLTWSVPVVATTKDNPNDFNDKDDIWVDRNPSSPFFGRVYLSWTEFRSATCCPSEPVDVSFSTDGGRTWSLPNQLSAAGNNDTGNGRQGSQVRTGPDGSVYVVWSQGSSQVIAISRDGGSSFSKAAPIGAAGRIDDPIPGASFRTDDFVTFGVDPTAGTGTIHVAWTYNGSGSPAGGRIVVATSTDRGLTWSQRTVSTPAEGYAFFPGLDVAPDGRVDLGYQALRAKDTSTFGTGNATIDSWYVSKPPGGAWSAPARVTSRSSDPAASAQNNLRRQFWGDYNTVASAAGSAWFIYTDARNGAGCPAVDAYQRDLFARGLIDEAASEDGPDSQGQAADEPVPKPAPENDCRAQFGNSDVYVSRITP